MTRRADIAKSPAGGRRRSVLALAILLLAWACDEQGGSAVPLPEELRNADGLVVQRPQGFRRIESSDGFAFQEEGMIRSPRHLRIALRSEPPLVEPDGSRALPGGSTALYAIEEHAGGSGGAMYELTAWRAVDGGWIVASETAQAELFEPEFEVVWAVIAQARIDGPAN